MRSTTLMLDLTKLAQQMQGISHYLTQEATATRQRLERAQQMLKQATQQQALLVERQHEWRDRLSFTAAIPAEPLHWRTAIPTAPTIHTAIATDGSQIAPSHHEIAYCYLINVGRIVLHYGQNRLPLLDSLPEVFYKPEDLYISRQWGIRTEEWMGYCRTVSEAVVLAELGAVIRREERGERRLETEDRSQKSDGRKGREAAETDQEAEGDRQELFSQLPLLSQHPTQKNRQSHATTSSANGSVTSSTPHPSPLTPHNSHPPAIAMVDGSLIYWFLEQLPLEARDRILPPILQAWEQLRQLQIPLVGYISASRSGEALNFLRLQACPYDAPDCLTHCQKETTRPPCQIFDPLKDATVWAVELQPGQRSPLWRSAAHILEVYGDHAIYFCYVHVGTEIARLEFPAWVVADPKLLDTALSLTLAQVQKGYGYPVALAEAHNQAVVRGGDRSRFFALLERQMINAGLRNVGTSYKEARKRGSIA